MKKINKGYVVLGTDGSAEEWGSTIITTDWALTDGDNITVFSKRSDAAKAIKESAKHAAAMHYKDKAWDTSRWRIVRVELDWSNS